MGGSTPGGRVPGRLPAAMTHRAPTARQVVGEGGAAAAAAVQPLTWSQLSLAYEVPGAGSSLPNSSAGEVSSKTLG